MIASSREDLLWKPPHNSGRIDSAEVAVDAVQADAARAQDAQQRPDALSAARLLRRIDQVVAGFATDIDHHEQAIAESPQA